MVSEKDFDAIAEFIVNELDERQSRRGDLEKQWKEIDRQLRMQPDKRHKLDANGNPDRRKAWLPETELPLQAQTLEVLMSDARRLKFPTSGEWFEAFALMTDDYLDKNDLSAIISGDKAEVPSVLDQDNLNKLVQGAISHCHRQYGFADHMDMVDAEAFKYSVGVGIVRPVRKHVFARSAKGILKKEQVLPIFYPRSIKYTYLDDSKHALMHEGDMISPSTLSVYTKKLKDVLLAANQGGKTIDTGGWMPNQLKSLKADKHGNITVVEFSGDLVVPKSQDPLFFTGHTFTVAIGTKNDKSIRKVVRVQENHAELIEFHYHREHIDSAYGSSPLMKGAPIQKAAVDALNKLLMAGALNVQPPISYSPDDAYFAGNNGPNVFPGAVWPTIDGIAPHAIGDPSAMLAVYAGLLQQYADVTGINAPRLGAQTVSHTTAYAKEAELARGTIRTVDYVHSSLDGPMTQLLDAEYRILKKVFKETELYIESYGGFVTIDKNYLPEAIFKVHGAGGPAEENAKMQRKLQSMQQAMGLEQLKAQADQIKAQTGQQTVINIERAIKQILREGGWSDVDAITNGILEGPEQVPRVAGNPSVATAPGAALQALLGQGAG